MKRGEIWIASLEPKKGTEVGKQRPVLILQTDLLNDIGHPTVLVAPISSQAQAENVLRYKVENSGLARGAGYVLIDQLRAVDAAHRLKKRTGKLRRSEMEQIGIRLRQVLDLPL
jgi:mRNA interferase MazF